MFRYKDRVITPGKGWKDDEGYQHPGNWNIWSDAEKKAKGVTEVTEDTPPDSRLYDWSGPDSNGKITSTAKALDDSGSGKNKVLGVKSTLKEVIKAEQGHLLFQTDWAVIRKADKGTEIPSNIQTWRDAIRAKATEMENAIDSASDTDAVAALFVVFDKDGNKKSGILYDWPELGE